MLHAPRRQRVNCVDPTRAETWWSRLAGSLTGIAHRLCLGRRRRAHVRGVAPIDRSRGARVRHGRLPRLASLVLRVDTIRRARHVPCRPRYILRDPMQFRVNFSLLLN